MTVHRGKTTARQYANVIHNALVSEGFSMISSSISDDGRVYMSRGVSGLDEIYIKIKDPSIFYLNVGVYEKYTPNATPGLAGTFGSGYEETTALTWASSNVGDVEIQYILNVTKDRIIIHSQCPSTVTNGSSSTMYIGLPKRYDSKDRGPGFSGIGHSTRGYATAKWRALRDRKKVTPGIYNYQYYMPTRATGWGGKLFFSPVIICEDNEGARGELDGLYVLRPPVSSNHEFQHYEEFEKYGKKFIIIDKSKDQNNSSSLPVFWYVIEI
ncbi:hypothetical protein ACK8P5_25585 (plasmid) [Paenibacillus sp. EC2-1]|uniref:hypothetical protein n=1 Tax=Paenibacillus sp. EC2-1 TaxID=3388665 RepID=UPI003BEF42AF